MNLFSNKKDEEYIFFNSVLYNQYKTIGQKNACIRECVEFLINVILNKISIENAEPTFEMYFKEIMLPFLRDAMRLAILIGWVPYGISKNREGTPVPYILNIPNVRMELVTQVDKNSSEFRFFTKEDHRIRNIFVLLLQPLSNLQNENLIYSLLDGLYDEYVKIEQLKRADTHAHIVRSNPSILLQPVKQMNANELDMMVGRTALEMAYDTMNDLNKQGDLLEMAHVDALSNVQFHYEQNKRYRESLEDIYAPQYENNLFIIPQNLQLAGTPQFPHPVANLYEIESFFFTKIYKSFGLSFLDNINRQIRRSKSPEISYSGSLEMETTLMFYATFIEKSIRIVYESMFDVPFEGIINFESYHELLKYIRLQFKPNFYDENDKTTDASS